MLQVSVKQMIPQDERSSHIQDLIEVLITSSKGQISFYVSQNSKFDKVARLYCEQTGWTLHKTRFFLDGDRVQNDLTLLENKVNDQDVLDAFQEVFGGKGPTDGKIRQMLEECDSDTEEVPESDENDNNTDVDYKWYENLKLELKLS